MPNRPQYRATIRSIKDLDKLTYMKVGDTNQLEAMVQDIERRVKN